MWRSCLGWSVGHICPCLGGSSQCIAADMQIPWQVLHFRPPSVYSLCLSLFLSSPFCPVDVTVHPVCGGRAARAAAAAAAAGRNARSPEELQWRHYLTSCLLLLLSSPVSLHPTHSYFCLHAHVLLSMPGLRAQRQSGVEEDGAKLQPVSRRHGLAHMEHAG